MRWIITCYCQKTMVQVKFAWYGTLKRLRQMINRNNICLLSGDSSSGLEATKVLWNDWGHGDSGTHYAGCDWTVGSVYSVQYPEEINDCRRVPETCQQQKVRISLILSLIYLCILYVWGPIMLCCSPVLFYPVL